MQFGFMPECETINAIFILRQLEMYTNARSHVRDNRISGDHFLGSLGLH